MLKLCRYCDKLYPESDFGVALTRPRKTYRRLKCKNCYRETKRLLVVRYRKWIEQYKQQRQCEICGISDFRVLDFHHGKVERKNFNISDFHRLVGFEKLKKEIKKCTLLCANCHRIEHYEVKLTKRGVAQLASARRLGR